MIVKHIAVLFTNMIYFDEFAFVEQSGTIKEQCFRWVDPLESTALSL